MPALRFVFKGWGNLRDAQALMDSFNEDREIIPVGILNKIHSVEMHKAISHALVRDPTCTSVLVTLPPDFGMTRLKIYCEYVMHAKNSHRYHATTPRAFFGVPVKVEIHDCGEHPEKKPVWRDGAVRTNPQVDGKPECDVHLVQVPKGTYIIVYRHGQSHMAYRKSRNPDTPDFRPATTTHNPIVTYWCKKGDALKELDTIQSDWAHRYGAEMAKRLHVVQFESVE